MWETRFVGVAAVGEQPVDLVTDDVAALLDAAVVAVGRGVNGLRHGSGRIGEKVNDVLMQNRSIGPSTRDAGRSTGGGLFSRGHIYKLLSNPIYVGRISHKGQVQEGRHPPSS